MEIRKFCVSFLLFFGSCMLFTNCQRQYDLTFRSTQCSDVDTKHIVNLTCRIKAVRGKKGILQLYWVYKDMKDVLVSLIFDS